MTERTVKMEEVVKAHKEGRVSILPPTHPPTHQCTNEWGELKVTERTGKMEEVVRAHKEGRVSPLPSTHLPTHRVQQLIQTPSASSTQPTHPPTHPPTQKNSS